MWAKGQRYLSQVVFGAPRGSTRSSMPDTLLETARRLVATDRWTWVTRGARVERRSACVRRPVGLSLGLAAVLMLALAPASAAAKPATGPHTLVIGVDHPDPANQQPFPPFNRVFEYTDFFSREVTIHSGDSLDFRVAPGAFHIVALATNERVARAVYPVALADTDHDGADQATGSGVAKVNFGPSNFPILGGSTHGGGQIFVNNGFGPPVCGAAALGQSPCTFRGGDDVEVIGPTPGFDSQGSPAFVDQVVNVTAGSGEYDYFCYIHPGMRGHLRVVDADDHTTTQNEVDARAQDQFAADQARALAAERIANRVSFSGGAPGTRTYRVQVGVGSPTGHFAIDEILPNQPLHLVPGDTVSYIWADPHNVHSVAFPSTSPQLPEPFGFDCGPQPPFYIGVPPTPGAPPPAVCLEPGDSQPEGVGDPGNAPPGTLLSRPTQLVDAGLRVGTAYGVTPSSQSWWLGTGQTTAAGAYRFQCTVHDWMQGTLDVSHPR